MIDNGQPCLARGHLPKQIHAGHIYSRGAYPSLRYNLHNIHRQSAQSNHFQNEDGLLRDGLKNEYGEGYYNFLSGMLGYKALKFSNEEYHQFYKKASKIALELRKAGKIYSKQERIDKRNEINLEMGIYDSDVCVFEL